MCRSRLALGATMDSKAINYALSVGSMAQVASPLGIGAVCAGPRASEAFWLADRNWEI